MTDSKQVIPLFDLNYNHEEEEAVLRVLRRKWLTMGEEINAFEHEFADFCGVKHALAVSSCTAALHLANVAAGVQPGFEVICPSLTFAATVNAVIYAGGLPVFADITSKDDWTISPDAIRQKITPRTKAIVVMHYGGFACRMEEILKIAESHKIAVIEDAAHAPGSIYRGSILGAIGNISCFSFFSNKNISTGEGGMICTNNDEYAQQIKNIRSHGMTSGTVDRHRGHAFSYDITALGYNYRLDEIHAALGRVQLKKLEEGNSFRRQAALRYKNGLKKLKEIKIPFAERRDEEANYHIFPVLLDDSVDRHHLMTYLRERGIQTSIHYPPVHSFSFHRQHFEAQDMQLTEYIAAHELTLPIYVGITNEQVDFIIDALSDYFHL
ncbi:MAG: DegT/DnrJ/EryC1/StrS family aminotransferase [Syntrophaceae bacterium]|nr:DegT/DnrJ/EryC1/StrS family aminotransferase [Syntrophaceae bacterium]